MLNTESIKNFIKRHPRINLLQYIFRKVIKDREKCEKFNNFIQSPYVVSYEHLGNLNKGTHIYLIELGEANKTQGYCSLLRETLYKIAYAERMGFVPVVNWTSALLYTEETDINNTTNSYEYFFLPVSHISVKEAKKSDLVVYSKSSDSKMFIDKLSYQANDNEIMFLAKYVNRIKFNVYGRSIIENSYNELIKHRKCLAVHIRGTDFKQNFSRHPVMPSLDEYIRYINDALKENSFDVIFLATDEEDTIEVLEKHFTNKILYFEAFRSKNGTPVHYGQSFNRKNHKYLLGQEILKDLYTMSRCDGLIAGLSNVSIMARALKYGRGERYEIEKIIDKGINLNMKESSFFIK